MRTERVALLLNVLAFVLCGCSGDADKPSGKQAPFPVVTSETASGSTEKTSKLDEVELQLNWLPEAEHGGFFAAEVHGLNSERRLKVKFIPGGPGVKVIENVASGKVMFGVANADQVLLGNAQEADVVALMAPIQQSPRSIMVHKKSGITKFDDLKDMTLAINPNQTFLGFLKKRLPLTNVRIVKYPNSLAPFLTDERTGQQAYVFSEPFVAQQQGVETNNLMVADLGFNPYTSVLITRAEVVASQPELVQRMVEASVLGWKKYLAEPAATNEHIHGLNKEMGLEILEFGVNALRPLCESNLSAPGKLGEMTLDRWKTLADQLVDGELLKPDAVDPTKVFETRFLPK